MRRFDPADPVAAEPPPNRRRRAAAARAEFERPPDWRVSCDCPSWTQLPASASEAAFSAGAGLALLDRIIRPEPPFAGALRQRLALRAATAAAMLSRRREDEAALRDAEHLASVGSETSPAGRLHRLWRAFAGRPATLDAAGLAAAAALVDPPPDLDYAALAGVLKAALAGRGQPLAAAATAGAVLARELPTARGVEMEILAWWAADIALAERLGWSRPVALVATTILHPTLRAGSNRRPRPSDPEWPDRVGGAIALAAQEALALAAGLSRSAERLLAVAPKLRAKGAGRVVELLLADDAVSPACAARIGGLSDRAARRLFDRLVELGVVRELSGRPNFRLYGL